MPDQTTPAGDEAAEPEHRESRSQALLNLTRGFRLRYFSAIAALALGTFIAYLGPLVTRATIDSIVRQITGKGEPPPGWYFWLQGTDVSGGLWISAVAIAALSALSGLFMYLKGRLAAEASEGAIRRLRNQLFDHLQHLPSRYFDRAETGDLVQRCTSDVETVRLFLANQVVEIGRAVLLLATVIPIMLALDPPMALVSLAGTPIIVAFSVTFFRRLKPAFLQMDQAEGRMTSVLQENLTGIRVVRAFARQEFEVDKFGQSVRAYRDQHYGLIRTLAIFWPLSDLLVFIQQGALLMAGAWWVSTGRLSVGTLVAFLLFMNIYIWPVRQMGRILTDLGKALVALTRIREILAAPVEAESGDAAGDAGPPTHLDGRIVFDGVSYRYDQETVLRNVSFQVEPGETLAIIGPSGAGKSTLVNLLLRLHDGAEGAIALDGRPLEELPRKWLRSQISVIMQEPFLYSKSVRENIALGRREASDEEIIDAANAAAVHDAILSFKEGYETIVGERGVTLSGGQRQRVALARALLQRPAILILDDALSAVDTETEAMILEALRTRHGAQTTLVIAHRISTLRHADKVLVLDQGEVQQIGTHQSLRNADGAYRRIWGLQTQASRQ